VKRLFIGLPFLIVLTLTVYFLVNFSLSAQKLLRSSKREANTKASAVKEIKIPKVTLETVFEKENDFKDLSGDKLIRLTATGDVIPARGVNWLVVSKKDFTYPFQKTADFLKNSDLTLINLEAPLISNCPLLSTGFTFCGDSRHIEGLLFAGVDVANISNNHIGNFGSSGITQTKTLLDSNSIGWSGFGNLAIKEVKGTRFGFLGYNGVGPKINREQAAKEISESRPKVDVLIISVHWGDEYVAIPQIAPGVAPDNPIEIGHLFIDSGADLVIGNHPHWVQGVELYKDKLITYAHGNFIFDQTWSEETQEGVVGTYTFYGESLVNASYKPIVVDKSYQPVFIEGERATKIIKQMRDSSIQMTNRNL
jgi:poly-gamma-glutamate synthesis protein (capsule biosynthesis protein)